MTARTDAFLSASVITHTDADEDGQDCCHAYRDGNVGRVVRGPENGKRNR